MRDKEVYEDLWASSIILPDTPIEGTVNKLLGLRDRYNNFAGVDWKLLAVLHMRECSNNFERQILNGEPWDQVTKLVPKGVGPFESWRDSTWYAIVHHGINGLDFGDIAQVLSFMEAWNGWGYAKRGVQSPYLWAGSQHGQGVGKYVADGKYDPNAIDKQLGAAIVYKQLTIAEGSGSLPKPIIYGDQDPNVGMGPVHDLQTLLVGYGAQLRGGVDGKFGPATAVAFQQIFKVAPYGV